MPTLKEYNVKLARLRSTRKMTKTMKMVSANKLRKAQEAQARAAEYQSRIERLVARVAVPGACDAPALLVARQPVRRVHVLVIASDRGLCGGFNGNIARLAVQWADEQTARGVAVDASTLGRRVHLALKNRIAVRRQYEIAAAQPSFAEISTVGHELRTLFEQEVFDGVFLAYNRFRSALTQTPVVEALLPVGPAAPDAATTPGAGEVWEPARAQMLPQLLQLLLNARLYAAVLSSAAGEHGARMTAMDNATRNAEGLIDTYTLRRNRVRQAAITTELTEIVAGAEALR